ncbi:GGDEF domain-containing protein [Jatrophihabitans sp.]|uniref:GGDEF domain-containing protein n=1 Tax=Jatrophihabitans sp. TaxID=1932789 RepID=UPI002C243476|nr:GGDEF domain-containing protein [Jatrophihabitans sp.]
MRLATYGYVDMTSVWTFGAALILPPGVAIVLCLVVLVHAWVRHGRSSGMRAYRQAFVGAVVIDSCLTARLVLDLFPDGVSGAGKPVQVLLALAVTMLVYDAVNFFVLYTGIYLAVRPIKLTELLQTRQDAALEIATLCLGGLTALALANQPLLAVLVVPPLFVLERSVLTKQLEVAATTDAKTGLLNAATWQSMAQHELARARREDQAAALLIIDMDNFKLINDTYGHIAGDTVLRAVADCLVRELRQYDAIGRFGGEEFVAVLSGVDELAAVAVSERVRQQIQLLEVATEVGEVAPMTGLSASIGISCFPEHGTELEDLLHAADSALYAAKRAGRNRVVVCPL